MGFFFKVVLNKLLFGVFTIVLLRVGEVGSRLTTGGWVGFVFKEFMLFYCEWGKEWGKLTAKSGSKK